MGEKGVTKKRFAIGRASASQETEKSASVVDAATRSGEDKQAHASANVSLSPT